MPNNEQQITHQFKNVEALNNAFMSYVRDGGIFIPTQLDFHLGDYANVSITLPESEQTFIFSGEVIWITPKTIHSTIHLPGIGIQCSGDEGAAFLKAALVLLADVREDGGSDTL